jgi:hypothetical protein
MYTAAKKSPVSGIVTEADGRLGRPASNVTPPEDVEFLMNFIDSFPRVPSHYCRKDSKREYLESSLNISVLYRLYQEKCKDENRKAVGRTLFNSLFADHEPPLAFYCPKKDQCPVCNLYKRLVADGVIVDKTTVKNVGDIAVQEVSAGHVLQAEEEEEDHLQAMLDDEADEINDILQYATKNIEKFVLEYQNHKDREHAALKMRDEDKNQAREDTSFRTITFDLQAILNLPYAAENQLYYVRKLNCYNFTIYDSHNQTGISYLWDETNGKKGSNEIGSCLLKYLEGLPSHVRHVTSFSDTCGGQNRNRNTSAAMVYAIQKIDHLEIIDLKFMESGHSYLEADSMHARIEEARRHKLLYTPHEYGIVIQCARINPKPYELNMIKFSDIYDWKTYSNDVLKNVKTVTKEENVFK